MREGKGFGAHKKRRERGVVVKKNENPSGRTVEKGVVGGGFFF